MIISTFSTDGFVGILSFLFPSSSYKVTTRSAVETASLRPSGDQHNEVTFDVAILSFACDTVFQCLNCMTQLSLDLIK